MTNTKKHTVEELLELALKLDPIKAIRLRRDADATLLWIDEIIGEDGQAIKLDPLTNRWGKSGWVYIYGRVSTQKQRDKEAHGEGWSMRTQFERAIHYCIAHRLQFCLFSDASLSGGMPTNDPTVIKTLWQTKANVYKSVMRAIFLPDYLPRPVADQEAVNTYIETKYQIILAGRVNNVDDMLDDHHDQQLFSQLVTINSRGQEVIRHIYRPGLNSLIHRLRECSMILVTDSSRVARSQYLMQHILPRLREHEVETKGLIEAWDWPNQDGFGAALQGSVLSALYEDMIRSATAGALRGIQTRLERGQPNGLLPFWYVKTPHGKHCDFCKKNDWETVKSDHHLCPVRVQHAQRMVTLYLDAEENTERGYQAVAGALEKEGIPPKKVSFWHWTSVRKVLTNPALVGKEREFGLLWNTLDRIISDEDWLRVCHKVRERGDISKKAMPKVAPRHLLTGLTRCVCGRSMTFAPEQPGNYTCNMMHYARVGTSIEHRRIKHSRINAALVDDFIDEIFREAAEWVVSYVQLDDQFDKNMANLREKLLALAKIIPSLEQDAIRQAEMELELVPTFASQKKSPLYKNALDATIGQIMQPHYSMRKTLREEIEMLKTISGFTDLSQYRREITDRIAYWKTMSIHDQNALLRTYFSELRLSNSATNLDHENKDEGDLGGVYIIPILRDGLRRWPPIHLTLSGTTAIRRKLPSVAAYIESTYESVFTDAKEG